jgi:hypothetical protein
MTYTGIFVDDQELVYAETMSSPGRLKFQIQEIQEVAVLARKIIAENPIIVAIDYRLDEAPANLDADQTYKGSALAQHLRDASSENPNLDFALVLVSAEAKIKMLYRPDKTAHDLFDRVYVKEAINQNRAAVRAELLSLCAGYEKLRAANKKYDIVELMGGTEDDRPFIDVQEVRAKLEDASAPHVVSRLLLNIIDCPGPLLDTNEACAYLGIDLSDGQAISELMRSAGIAYDGLYSEGWSRWWANRLEDWSQGIFGRRATGLPASDRAHALSEASGQRLSPAKSPWNGSPNELISFACASCRRGTELRHSVAAFEVTQPRYITRRRICWDCVQTDQYEAIDPPLSIDDADADLAQQVKARDRNIGNSVHKPNDD